jgi:hypothetical protein
MNTPRLNMTAEERQELGAVDYCYCLDCPREFVRWNGDQNIAIWPTQRALNRRNALSL